MKGLIQLSRLLELSTHIPFDRAAQEKILPGWYLEGTYGSLLPMTYENIVSSMKGFFSTSRLDVQDEKTLTEWLE